MELETDHESYFYRNLLNMTAFLCSAFSSLADHNEDLSHGIAMNVSFPRSEKKKKQKWNPGLLWMGNYSVL